MVAEHCKLEFKYLGRYGSGVLKLLSCNHIMEKLRGSSRAIALLKNMKADVLRQEDHDNENVVLDSYSVFKSEKLAHLRNCITQVLLALKYEKIIGARSLNVFQVILL